MFKCALLASMMVTASASNTTVCWKDTIDRGVGKPISACDSSKGLEISGALCYPKCKEASPSYYGVGPVCWQHCKAGYVDEGALCRQDGGIETYAKSTYGRGAGLPLGCPQDQEEDAALCYPRCKDGYYGVGPVCWESCPTMEPSDGGAICCKDAQTCTDKIIALTGGLPLAVMHAILAGEDPKAIIQAVIDALQSILGFVLPKCSAL